VYETILLKMAVPNADPRNESARLEGNRFEPAMCGESLNSVLRQEIEAFVFIAHRDSRVFVFLGGYSLLLFMPGANLKKHHFRAILVSPPLEDVK
jgi:hypothetical protein